MHPAMKEFPEERQGFTDMTFSLIRFEVTNIFRRILYIPPSPGHCQDFFSGLSIPEKERWISNCHQRLEDKYLKNCDMTIPLCWITATVSRMIMSKMWLIVYHPHQRRDGGASLPQETKDKLFITSLENIEYSILIETEARTMQWGWLFRTYVQWHAIAFLLSELCVRTKGEAVERAWRALDATAGRWWFPLSEGSPHATGQAGCLWRPLRKLMAKARASREKELALERASQALKKDGMIFPGNYQFMPTPLNATVSATEQPDSDALDKMLRPEAQKFGSMPASSPPICMDSPTSIPAVSTGAILSTTSTLSDDIGKPEQPRNEVSHSEAFNTLFEHGLDYVMNDLLHRPQSMDNSYLPLDDTQGTDSINYMPSNQTSITQPPGQNLTTTTSSPLDTVNPGTDGNYDTRPSLTGLPSVEGSGLYNNDALEMGDLGDNMGTEMDWAVWDDLVGQYGVDGVVLQGPTANGAGHLGKVGWF